MRIVVPMKQVPATTQVNIDPATGTLMRGGVEGKVNPYDLYALESALRIKEKLGATVCAVTMGPPQAEEILREAYMMGADEAFLISDRAFAGADVLATSYTLAGAIRKMGGFDLIICGRQTTDGDTAQVGPALAEHLGLPHTSWVTAIEGLEADGIWVEQEFEERMQRARLPFPCLITVEKTICQPRLPSYLLKKKTAGRLVRRMTLADLEADPAQCGIHGSPTRVEEVFVPARDARRERWEGGPADLALRLHQYLAQHRLLDEHDGRG